MSEDVCMTAAVGTEILTVRRDYYACRVAFGRNGHSLQLTQTRRHRGVGTGPAVRLITCIIDKQNNTTTRFEKNAYAVVNWFSGKLVKLVPLDVRCSGKNAPIAGVELSATGGYVGTVSGDLSRSTQDVSVYWVISRHSSHDCDVFMSTHCR